MPASLSTHVLDTAGGRAAANVRVQLLRDGDLLVDTKTNTRGRCDAPLLEGAALVPGAYQILFHIGAYFLARGVPSPFLDVVPVHFLVTEGESYHIPLVCSPWSYSTYRGS